MPDLEPRVVARVLALIVLGGKGSGHFGHEGRPGLVGGSGPGEFYHGTSAARLQSILKNGLSVARAGESYQLISDKGVVYVTSDFEHAKIWAEDKYDAASNEDSHVLDRKGNIAVLKIEIPASEAKLLKKDRHKITSVGPIGSEIGETAFQFHSDIKPEWITEVWVSKIRGQGIGETRDPWRKRKLRAAEEVITLYVPLILLDEDDELDRVLGGPGSGHFGHAGRPGEVGGSAATLSNVRVTDLGEGYRVHEEDEGRPFNIIIESDEGKIQLWHTPERTIVDDVFVSPQRRGEGFGKALYEEALAYAVAKGSRGLVSAGIRTKAASRVWESFRKEGRVILEDEEENDELLLPKMRRVLGGSSSGHLRFLHLPGKHEQKSHGYDQSHEGGLKFPTGLTKVGSAMGSNPGGVFRDATGQKWYVKQYKDPEQAYGEHLSNAIYEAADINAPISVLGEPGQYASKWLENIKGTVQSEGLDKATANHILDGFAADVFLSNWDTVGLTRDNVAVHTDGSVTRIDQGGTLLHRAQGALKPPAALATLSEWEFFSSGNREYRDVFKAAGVKDGDALGQRAVEQINRITAIRPPGGWTEFVDRRVPSASNAWKSKVSAVLEQRQKLLEKKRDQLRSRAAEMRFLHLPGQHEQKTHGYDQSGEKKKKAPKAAPVSIDLKKAAYADVKAGGTFKATAQKYGLTQGQLAGYVWKVDQAKQKIEEGLQEEQAIASVVKAVPKPLAVPQKTWNNLTQDEKLAAVHQLGYEWKPKPNSKSGNYAWYDAQGNQVSSYAPKEQHREVLEKIHFGAGPPELQAPSVSADTTGAWPIGNSAERSMNSSFENKMTTVHTNWASNLTSAEVHAIENYTSSGYSGLNAALRQGTSLSGYTDANTRLNTAIAKAPSPPPPDLVWRGIRSHGAAGLFADLATGDTVTMKGFQSASIKPRFAYDWADSKMIFEIKPNKGMYAKLRSSHPGEYEYILPHGAKYAVRGVTKVKFQGVSGLVRVVQLEMHQ